MSARIPAATRLLALGSAAALLVAGCGKSEAPGPKPGAWYVAMGDSGTSGAGIAPVADEGCARSEENYPSLLAEKLDVSSFADVSCGGATTGNLSGFQDTEDDKKRRPQLDALSSKTRLVTLGIGLNDNDLAFTLLYLCSPSAGNYNPLCADYLKLPAAGFTPYLEKLRANVTAAIEAVQEKAPNARIVLVDYPRYAPDTGDCPTLMPMPTEAVDRARTVLAEVSALYREVAAQTGVLFADMYDASKGHDVCSAEPWVHGSTNGSKTDGAELHPYPAYHRAVADRIADLLGT